MARRIRWQIVIAALSMLLVAGLLGRLALRTAASINPLAGGAYIEAIAGAPAQPMPLLNDPLADPAGRALVELLFNGLMRVGADGLLEPALAADYQIDPTGEVYTFSLRRNVRWHDGTPFTANDVIFTLRTLQTMAEPGDTALARLWQGALVNRIDDYTVRVTLMAPFAPFLSIARVPILPAHLLAGTPPERWSETPFASTLTGTGPFRLVELSAERARLEANPDYWEPSFGGARLPYLDSIELRFIATPAAAVAALARGDLTAYGERVGTTLAGVTLPGNLRLLNAPLDEYSVLSFNLREEPLDELPLRRALAYGLSRDALIERGLDGLASPIVTPILPGSWANDPTAPSYKADAEAAERLLNELGYEPGIDGVRAREGQRLAMELIVDGEPRRRAAAAEIARQWAALGVAVEVRELPPDQLLRRLQDRDFTLALHSWARLGPDPDPFALWHSSQAEAGLNYAGLEDRELDTLLEEGRRESDLVQRGAIYAAFQRRWAELVPALPLYQPHYYFAVDEGLGGVGLAEEPGTTRLLFGPEDRYRGVARWFTASYREIQGDLE